MAARPGGAQRAWTHRCHAAGCETAVAPKLLMCVKHWRMVPRLVQQQVWATYRAGQEVDKRPSRDYLAAADAAIAAVAAAERRRAAPPARQGMLL